MATGGGDARVQIWEDCTLQDKAEEAEEQEVTLLKQQRLSNALQVRICVTPYCTAAVHAVDKATRAAASDTDAMVAAHSQVVTC